MTLDRDKKVRGCQRRMLRTMLGKGRQPLANDVDNSSESLSTATSNDEEALESYVDWIQRVTHEAEEAMSAAGVPDWVEESRRRKW
eukprot:3610686-Karenia_brevis.AAC.1